MVTKFDNLGNALLDALDESLCSSCNYRPLITASPTLHFIKDNLNTSLWEALTQFTASKLYTEVEVITVIVFGSVKASGEGIWRTALG